MLRLPLGSFSVLGSRDFRRLWLALVLGNSGRWAFTLGVSWFTYQSTRSPLWAGLAVMATQAPALMVSPVAGAWADRWARKRLLVATFGLAAVSCAGLTLLVGLADAPPWAVVALSFLFGSAFAAQTTVSNSLLPGLVPGSRLVHAVSLQSMAFHGSQLLGSAMAGPLLGLRGAQAVFGLCLSLYATAALVASTLRASGAPARDGKPVSGTLALVAEGWHYVKGAPLLAALLAMVTLHCGLTMSYMGVLPHLAARSLGAGGALYSSLMMAVGLGAVSGTVSMAGGLGASREGWLYLLTAVASGACLVGLAVVGLVPWKLPWALAMMAGVGASQAMFMALSQAWTVGMAPDALRGRVASFFSMLATGAMAVGNWSLGGLAERWQPAAVVGLAGMSFVTLAILGCVLYAPLTALCARGRAAVQEPAPSVAAELQRKARAVVR